MYSEIWRCGVYVYSLYLLFQRETEKNLERVKEQANKCGPIGKKMLQYLVCTDRFFSAEYKKKLNFVLEDNEAHDFTHTAEQYEIDFGRTIYDDFEIDMHNVPQPVGSGTIGQVYKLFDKSIGKFVAVKSKHPGVDKHAMSFSYVISYITCTLERFMTLPFAVLIKEFVGNIEMQLDYKIEAYNMSRMHEHTSCEDHIIIPFVHRCSSNFIVMDYHEGVPYDAITDKQIRKNVSIDLYLFTIASLLNYDLIHCDLHMGNWKVALYDDNRYKIIIYDFGLVATINNKELSENVVKIIFNEDLIGLSKAVSHKCEQHPNWQLYLDKVIEIKQSESDHTEKYSEMFKQAMILGMPLNPNVMRCFQGILISMKVINTTRITLAKVLGDDGNCANVMIAYNVGLIKKLGKHKPLGDVFESWMEKDPMIKKYFDNWLYDNYGHRNHSVFVDITVDGLKF